MTEEVIGTLAGKTMVKKTFTGPASYTSGGEYAVINKLAKVDAVLELTISGGYIAARVPDGLTGNAAKYKVYYQTGESGEALTEVAGDFALTGETLEMIVLGD